MLKYSKSFKFLIGTFAVLALGAFLTASAAWDFGTSTLKVGSKGEYVKTLQTLVGASPVDGVFGNGTKAKVMAWQANNGLTADGVFGNMSKAKANEVSTGGSYPAGCSSNMGFSTTTGQSCAGTVSTVPGCTAGALFSSTTGASCSGTVTTGPLAGGAGDIQTVEVLSSVSGEKVGEGAVDHKVFAYTVEADNGSDISLNSVKLNLQRTGGSGSTKLNRYANNVSVWMGSTKVGSALVSSFSESANVYSKSIALSGAVIKADQKNTFYVTVDSLGNIDSTDLSSNTWTVTLESTRFSDATGAILTDSTASILKTFEFASLATANDVELKVNLSTSNMKAATIKVSTTSSTNQVELTKFTMKAQGSDMVIDQIPVLFTTTETDLDEVTSNVTLKIGGNTYNETVVTAGSATATVLFNDLNLSVSKDATLEGTIYADLNDIEASTFDEGTTLKAEITSALVVAVSGNYIDVEDMNGDQLVTGDRTGSAIGEAMTFRSQGVSTVMGTPTISKNVDTNGAVTQVTYTIPVTVTAFGATLYTGQSVELATAATGTNAFSVALEDSSAPATAIVTCTSCVYTLSSSDAVIEGSGYRLDDGTAKHFTLTVDVITPTTVARSYRVQLEDVRTFTDSALSAGALGSALTPSESFQTGYQYITS